MAYNVGQAEVTVLPNADRFNEDLAAKLLPAAEATGREIGDRIAAQIRERMAQIGDVNLGVDTGKASVEVDKFIAETEAKTKAAGLKMGTEFGTDFSNATSKSASGLSPLIVGAVAGGLLVGGPAVIGAAGLLFGGIAAAAVHSQAVIHDSTANMLNEVMGVFKSTAQVTVPAFVGAINRIGPAFSALAPQFASAFSALTGPIDSLTTGVIGLVTNAMPGLVAAVQAASPVFRGLAALLSSVGTGLGDFFSIIAQHGAASGTVFAALGQAVGALLPILAQLVGAGAELGAQILPPLASVLGLVAKALNLIAPVLPVVAAGFLAFKVVGTITPMLDAFAQKMAFASYSTGPLAGVAGKASTAVSGLASVLPAVGIVAVAVGGMFQASAKQTDDWATALLQGGQAAETAAAQMHKQETAGFALNEWWDRAKGLWNDGVAQLQGYSNASDEAAQKSKDLYAAMSPLERAQQDVTTATNNLSLAQQKYGIGSVGEHDAAELLIAAKARQAAAQQALTDATNAALDPEERHKAALQGIATAASTAKTDTNLLKTALDALSGKTVDTVTAQIQLQDAVANATTATKGLTGSVVDGHGQLNIYTAAGRAAGSALINIRDSGNQLIATLEKQGGTAEQVSAADGNLRSSFIKTAQQMGFTAGQANDLADQILGIPTSRNTRITADTVPALNAIDQVLTALARVQNKTVTVTTVTAGYHVSGGGGPGGTQVANARGNIIHAYADGGIEPMSSSVAKIVPPNTLRVIGDRVTNDEAFIPINRDLRSVAIWREAGQRMGQLNAAGHLNTGGGTAVADKRALFNVETMIVPDAQHPAETAEALAFLARTR